MDEDREGCPPTEVKKLVLHDRRITITVKHLSSETGISVGSIELILND